MGVEAVEELLTIAREANIPAEIYHLKAAGTANWPKMDEVIARVEDGYAIFTVTDTGIGIEAVQLAKEFSTDDSPSFVNGVLGAVLRQTAG